MKFMYDSMRNWDASTTRPMIMYSYWWRKVGQDVFRYMKACDPCPQMMKLSAYQTDLTRPAKLLFDGFSINFAWQFYEIKSGHKHLLACV